MTEVCFKYMGASIAVGLGALATAYVQGKIGSAAVGALIERKELTGLMVLLLAIPETMVILGFVIAVMILLS